MKIVSRLRAVVPPVLLAILVGAGLLALLESYPTKEEWLRSQAKKLTTVKITPEMIAKAAPWRKSFETYFYSLPGSKGTIPIGKDRAVYVVTHSLHDNESMIIWLLRFPVIKLTGRNPVGDAIMAVDQQGQLYTNEGHVCGVLELDSQREVRSLEDFLETHAYDSSEHTWKPYHPE